MLLATRYERIHLGREYFAYSFTSNDGVTSAPVWFIQNFGGSSDSREIVTEARFMTAAQHRLFLGVEERGVMSLKVPANRLQGEVIVRRREAGRGGAAAAEFVIYAQQNETHRYERWRQRVELPAGQDEVVVPYAIDGSGMPTTFIVEIPPEHHGVIVAGWRGPQITHVGRGGPDEPAWFYRGWSETVALDEKALALLLPDNWRPEQAFMRNGRVVADGIELLPGGEIWLKAKGFVMEFMGVAKVEEGWDPQALPFVRGMWYLGGRHEVFSQMVAREQDHAADFRAWCAEPGGWLVIGVDPTANAPAVRVRVHKVTQN
jgi:hypothetical protein